MRTATAVVGALLVVAAAAGAGPVAASTAASGSGSASVGAGAASALADARCAYPMTVTDATETEVRIEGKPDRLVALAPSAAQILWSIGARDEVVAMPQDFHLGYLDGTEGKTDVMNDDGTVITEAVVGSEPDLVLAPNVVPNETVDALRENGLTVYKFANARSLEDVYAKIELYGRLTGHYDRAGKVSARMQGQVRAVRDAVSDEDNPRVFLDVGGGYTAGEDTFIGGLVAAAGGDNVAAGEINTSSGYGRLNDEVVAKKDPEWIVLNGRYATVPKTAAFNRSTAVEEGNVVRVNADFTSQNGPRNVVPLKAMAKAFHPDAYEGIDFPAVETPQPASCSTPTPTATAAATPAGDGGTATATSADDGGAATAAATASPADTTAAGDPATPAPGTTSGGGPGFTGATALVALLAGALVARRR